MQPKEVTCLFWFPKQQNNPNSQPWDTQCLLMSKPWSARMYRDRAGSPSKCVVQLCLAVGGTSSPTVRGLGVGWVSAPWALITLWKLWDSPGLKAGIFTGGSGSRGYVYVYPLKLFWTSSQLMAKIWSQVTSSWTLVRASGNAGFESTLH